MFYFYDSTMLLLIPALILAFYAQSTVQNTYKKYLRVPARKGLNGAEAARRLLEYAGITDVKITPVAGFLTDHYDPRAKVLRLSEHNFSGYSIAAVSVAAHEAGHAMQHHHGYYPLILRNNFVPLAGFGSSMAIPLFLIGLFLRTPLLMDIGIICFGFAVAFHLVTLPVELNASSRAIGLLQETNLLQTDEIAPAKKVLRAAALTYIASALMALLQLIRLVLLRDRN